MADPRFPLLTEVLTDKRLRGLTAAADLVEQGLAAGSIPNPVYQDLKGTVSRAFEEGWERLLMQPYCWQGGYSKLPPEIQTLADLVAPQAHTVQGHLRKANATQSSHPFRPVMIDFLKEIETLAAGVVQLKSMTVKRQPKADATPATPGYHPPPVQGAAQKKVLALLEDITAAAHAGVLHRFQQRFNQHVIDFISADREAHAASLDPLSPARYLNNPRAKTFNPEAYDVVERAMQQNGARGRMTVRDNYEQIIADLSLKAADEVRTSFVHKNFAKIASIVDAKGNFDRGEVVGRSLDMGGLEGSIRFHFEDGSSFVAKNAVVWSQSSKGTVFSRYPLTFHDAILPDGSRMPRPDEAGMNEVFAVAGEGTPALRR